MIQALGHDVILHPIEQPSITLGGIHRPDAYKKRPVKGVVISKGPNCRFEEISAGDVVLINAYAGNKITLEDEGIFWIAQEKDIIAKILAEPKVRLVDTETMKRLIIERLGEIKQADPDEVLRHYVAHIGGSILDRIDSLTQAEGFEF